MQTTRTTLAENWRFKELTPRGNSTASDLDWMPAEVPGHVHLDLRRSGVIPDPFYRLNERSVAWVDETDWVYECDFEVAKIAPLEYLRFEGLDTVSEISLNGMEIGQTDNMFIPHEFRVDSLLRRGTNTLRIVFRSALRVGRERQAAWQAEGNDTLPRPDWFVWGPRSFVRKAQYMFGWDWGPELVSCGIWKPVERISIPLARLRDHWCHTRTVSDGTGSVIVMGEVESLKGERLTVAAHIETDHDTVSAQTEIAEGEGVRPFRLEIAGLSVSSWAPRVGNGIDHAAKLYSIRLSVSGNPGVADACDDKTGFSDVALDTEPDNEGGSRFALRVKGELTFCKGANWIPVHSFPSSMSEDRRTQDQVRLAAEAGVNMLRVWGGGLYESEAFYDACDAFGILVWQDFPYGCAYYPDSGPYAEAARTEAEAALKRIGKHPCLALLCGNNENHPMWRDGWERQENRAPRFLGERLYHEILPEATTRICPRVPYWPGSPFGGEDPNGQEEGDRHNWDVWHGRGDWPHYREDRSRFVSEFGFASSCGKRAWDQCLAQEDYWPRSPAVRWHDKTRKGYETYLSYIGLHFPEPRTLEDLVYYSQLNQAEALKCGVEHWRRQKGRCWGTLFWQWNDCWPVQSWSVLDFACEPKAAYYFAKRFYAPVLLSLVREGDRVCAHLTNDLPAPVQGELKLSVRSFDGEVLRDEAFDAFADGNATGMVGELNVSCFLLHARDVFIHARFEPLWEIGQERIENHLFLAEPKELRLADPGIGAQLFHKAADTWQIEIAAQRFAPYVWVRMEERVHDSSQALTDNFFHLTAGEPRVIERQLVCCSEEELRASLRIRSL